MTNCLFYAVALFWRRRGTGNRRYLAIRRSDSGNFPHFLYAELRRGRWRVISYKPIFPHHRMCPPLLFAGRARWGDASLT
jgi:hypothetical protein